MKDYPVISDLIDKVMTSTCRNFISGSQKRKEENQTEKEDIKRRHYDITDVDWFKRLVNDLSSSP